jgi:hypothetical protein
LFFDTGKTGATAQCGTRNWWNWYLRRTCQAADTSRRKVYFSTLAARLIPNKSNTADAQIMKVDVFLKKLNDTPKSIAFDETMAAIGASYEFTPASFTNGVVKNEAGQNNGSCKLFAFALLNQLTEEQTLACFGAYYRDDVQKNPEGTDHQNIRNFMKTGWSGVKFDSMPLQPKSA